MKKITGYAIMRREKGLRKYSLVCVVVSGGAAAEEKLSELEDESTVSCAWCLKKVDCYVSEFESKLP